MYNPQSAPLNSGQQPNVVHVYVGGDPYQEDYYYNRPFGLYGPRRHQRRYGGYGYGYYNCHFTAKAMKMIGIALILIGLACLVMVLILIFVVIGRNEIVTSGVVGMGVFCLLIAGSGVGCLIAGRRAKRHDALQAQNPPAGGQIQVPYGGASGVGAPQTVIQYGPGQQPYNYASASAPYPT